MESTSTRMISSVGAGESDLYEQTPSKVVPIKRKPRIISDTDRLRRGLVSLEPFPF